VRIPPGAAALLLALPLAAGAACPPDPGGHPVVQVETSLGELCLRLLGDAAPATVANFLGYVGRGDYDGSFFHRLVPGFVLQGGGFRFDNGSGLYQPIPQRPPVVNEPGVSNRRGTVAMAKLEGQPDSATKEWFVNLADNSANLDVQNGGFTVFAVVEGGLPVADAIAALPRLGLEARLQRTPFREAFLDAPLLSPLPGPSGADCFSLASVGALTAENPLRIVRDPVSFGPVFVSPACRGVRASGTCAGPGGRIAVYNLATQVATTPLTDMTCDEIEASDLSLSWRRARVRERLVEIERAFAVPEPGGPLPAAAGLLAAALAARRLRPRV
jgi:cyclophilin family peptidyl-prolyl cis-trans isomerase